MVVKDNRRGSWFCTPPTECDVLLWGTFTELLFYVGSSLQSELTELVQTYKQEVTEAACELICDWAQKILKRSFDTVVEIARYLIQEHIVNPRCSQADLVTSAALAG